MGTTAQPEGPVQRLRVVYSRGEEIKYISHLDTMRAWERILRRAKVPLAYTHGFNPQPRIALASPLPVGVTSDGEALDVFLDHQLSPQEFRQLVEPQLPAGLAIREAEDAPLHAPSLQSSVRFADYRVELTSDLSRSEVEERVRRLLEASELMRERRREKGVRRYDLRPLIETIQVAAWNAEQALEMRLLNGPSGAGRPEEVVAALGLDAALRHTHRVRLLFEHD
jgi:radical SAM-linked protein